AVRSVDAGVSSPSLHDALPICRLPGQAAHGEPVVILGVIVLPLAVLQLADETIGQRVTAVQRIAHVHARFFMVKGAVGDVSLTNALETRLLADKIDRAAWVCRTKQGGVGSTQNFNALIGKGLLAYTAHRTQGQAVPVGGGLETA